MSGCPSSVFVQALEPAGSARMRSTSLPWVTPSWPPRRRWLLPAGGVQIDHHKPGGLACDGDVVGRVCPSSDLVQVTGGVVHPNRAPPGTCRRGRAGTPAARVLATAWIEIVHGEVDADRQPGRDLPAVLGVCLRIGASAAHHGDMRSQLPKRGIMVSAGTSLGRK